MESGEKLRADNERLVAEMASMKKKIKLAMKKQQAELQAKIQAAEQRAAAAEAAAAAADVNVAPLPLTESFSQNGRPPSPASSGNPGANGALASSSSLASRATSVGEVPHHPLSPQADGESIQSQGSSTESLLADLSADGQQLVFDDAIKERQRLENEVSELRKASEIAIKGREETTAEAQEELRLVQENAEQRVRHLAEENEKLEIKLIEATNKLAEASTRIAASQLDIGRISRECQEAKDAQTDMSVKYESLCQDLEQSRSAQAVAQQELQNKMKEVEELAAARKAAQEGQEAAISQLMHRLAEMESTGNGEEAKDMRQLSDDSLQILHQEKADLMKELGKIKDDNSNLLEEISAYRHRIVSLEAGHLTVDSQEFNHEAETKSDWKDQYEGLLEEVRSHKTIAADLQHQVEELRNAGQQAPSSSLQEVSSLQKKLEESSTNQKAAEDQIKRLSGACNDAEQQVMGLTQELADARRSLDEEIRIRDDKYAELDAKFGRLQKRAKQRIQEVQKEREDMEVQLAAAGEKAGQALSKQASIQDDLERARFQAGEALRHLDAERQQLRVSNIKLRDEIEDLRRLLDGKEHNLAESRRLASEKDQAALELAATLQEAEGNHSAALSDIKEKHRKTQENLKGQLVDAASEGSKMAETISALQAQLGAMESKHSELDTASSGEMARLRTALEGSKGEFARLEMEHKKEQEVWEANLDKHRRKVEELERSIQLQEVANAELRSKFETKLEQQRQLLSISQTDLAASKDETARISNDLASYKVRAYALLQKKEAELLAARDSELAAAQEAALKDAKREAVLAALERDEAVKSLKDAVSDYENKLAAREVSVLDAQQRIRDLATKVEASKGQLLVEREEWQSRVEQVEANWREKCDKMEASARGTAEADMKHDLTLLMTDYNNLKIEFETFRDLVDSMVEEKDEEIARLLEENASLQQPSTSVRQVQSDEQGIQAQEAADLDSGVVQVAEQQILLLARQQAQREDEVSQCRRHIQVLQEEITDLEQENRLHGQQEALLKEELRSLDRAHKRDGVDMTYLKNVILKLLETGEVEALLPVVAMLLQFSPDELKRCHETYNTAPATSVPFSSAAAAVDHAVSTPRTFLSKLNLTSGS